MDGQGDVIAFLVRISLLDVINSGVRLIGVVGAQILEQGGANLRESQLQDPRVDGLGNLCRIGLDGEKVKIRLPKEHGPVLKTGLQDVRSNLGLSAP